MKRNGKKESGGQEKVHGWQKVRNRARKKKWIVKKSLNITPSIKKEKQKTQHGRRKFLMIMTHNNNLENMKPLILRHSDNYFTS